MRVDLAGHGDSGRGRKEWTIVSFAQDVLAVIEALDAGVIGIDTWSALGSTRRNDDLEASILLPEMQADFVTGSARFVNLMCGPAAPPEVVSRLTDEVREVPPDIALGIFKGAGEGYATELAENLRSLDVAVSAISSETFMPKDNATFTSLGRST